MMIILKLNELPKELQELAAKRSEEQGKVKYLKLMKYEYMHMSFKWARTPEGHGFWDCVSEGKFDELEKKYIKNL